MACSHTVDGEIEFHEAPELTSDQIRQVGSALPRHVLRYFRRHGLRPLNLCRLAVRGGLLSALELREGLGHLRRRLGSPAGDLP